MPRIDFFVAGVQKAGSTALDAYLRQHPSIQMPKIKELHFFDNESIDWKSPDYSVLQDAFGEPSAGKIRGEATPIYTFWPNALERIRRYNPETKIIVALRHPTFRAYSHWRMEVGRGRDTLPFEEAISPAGRARLSSASEKAQRYFSYVERGFYGAQIRRLIGLFPARRIFFYRTDHLWNDPEKLLGEIQDFLEVERRIPATRTYISPLAERSNALSNSDRLALDAIFADDIRAAARLTALNLEDWLDPEYREPMSPG